jgi:hypothetical protein
LLGPSSRSGESGERVRWRTGGLQNQQEMQEPMRFLFRPKTKSNGPAPGPELDRQVFRELGDSPATSVPACSTDDKIAASVAERFSNKWGWCYYEKREGNGTWTVGWIERTQPLLRPARPVQASGRTRALAICCSILKVAESMRNRSDARSRFLERPPAL